MTKESTDSTTRVSQCKDDVATPDKPRVLRGTDRDSEGNVGDAAAEESVNVVEDKSA